MLRKKTIFLTGATGTMGRQTLRQLLEHTDVFDIVVLVLPTKKEKQKMAAFRKTEGLRVVWGDLCQPDDVLRCVNGSDIILHVGGMVSPMADYLPEKTMQVNLGAVRNILAAIRRQPDPDAIRLVYIGSVAQTGNRASPRHWGRTGDPICISAFDHYALSKTLAEREIAGSGLRYWVSLRQTGILYGDLVKKLDPILFHETLNGVLEWVSDVDSGRMLVHLCLKDLPETFWRRFYNVGGGPTCRSVNYDFLQKSFQAMGIRDFRKLMDCNWFATRNFHGQWYEDSDVLENYLHFRQEGLDDFFANVMAHRPFQLKLAGLIPAWIMKHLVFKPIANKPLGCLHWIKQGQTDRIRAAFGSRTDWEALPDWKGFHPEPPSREVLRLDHGYDESKPWTAWNLDDMRQAAAFRGGKCLAKNLNGMDEKLRWRCTFGHDFEASPRLVLLGGHWCPDCLSSRGDYEEEVKHNAFLAQVWQK